MVDKASNSGEQARTSGRGRSSAHAQNLSAFDIAALAPAGYYLALRLGFASPVDEVNRLPDHWVQEYTRNGYAPFDPLVHWIHSEVGACRWSAVKQPDDRRILARAKAQGLTFGAVVSVRDPGLGPQRSFGTFARPDREFTDEELAQLNLYVRACHEAMLPPQNLTEAELVALRLLKDGLRLKQIAWRLGISEGAVKQRLKNARLKLSAKTVAEAIAMAASFRLV